MKRSNTYRHLLFEESKKISKNIEDAIDEEVDDCEEGLIDEGEVRINTKEMRIS